MTIATTPALVAGTWAIDPAHSEVGFTVRHLMTKVRGSFREFEGTVEVAEDLAASKVNVTIQLASIDTGTKQRDDHVRSGDFLDIDNHPVMTFVSEGVRPNGGTYLLDGTLTIRDVARPITLDVEFNGTDTDPWGGTRAGFSATASISRKEYGIEFNVPLGGDKALLGDKVDIQLEVQAVKA